MMKKLPTTVKILGTETTIMIAKSSENPNIKECSGYYDWTDNVIILEDYEEIKDEVTILNYERYKEKVLRHEIVHAFMYQSGLHEAATFNDTHFEQMVDWVAIMYPKMKEVFKELDIEG